MLTPVRIAAPATTPVSLDEAKAHLRVDHDDQDGLIAAHIEAATAWVDGFTGIVGRALVTQTWRQDFAGFAPRLCLPLVPASAIVSVSYFDVINDPQTLDAGTCALLSDARGAYVVLQPGHSWPATWRRDDAVSVIFTAGYGDPADVPQPLRQAIQLLVQRLFDGADASIDAANDRVVDTLIAPYRRRAL
ncbi:head-tail connector protein [Microbaculum marinum]|uniref:Head-tail connector protein n=1 Tax=Microbaculum marinum TaxID=1764581 RepID=A0AAW9RBB7_9HYPH